MIIRELQAHDLPSVKAFTDQWIGENYYQLEELSECLKFSQSKGLNASFLALDGEKIVGVRLTYAPGAWVEKARGITPDKWESQKDQVAYFKSLFIHGDYQKRGIGKMLSDKSIGVLKELQAKAIVCHSWLESPGNSSQKYLMKMGFSEVAQHPKFWYPIDYECTRCAPDRCICTASEMIKFL